MDQETKLERFLEGFMKAVILFGILCAPYMIMDML